MDELVSVIMSTFNETEDELMASISSILNQTYSNIEYIIVNDNPKREDLNYFLSCIDDNRVVIVKNDINKGLVESLNIAISRAQGKYIARMDADDIAMPKRLEEQLRYLITNNYDMIGCYIKLIDEFNNVIKDEMRFPLKHDDISFYIRWGSCLAHPTWFLKKSVYDELLGYRNIKSCEDYDFLLRVLYSNKYRVGNVPYVGLKYRIRKKGISASTILDQYILRRYLSRKRREINDFSEKDFAAYQETIEYKSNVQKYKKYLEYKNNIKSNKSISSFVKVIFNKYFYILLIENYYIKKREKV